MIYLQDEDVNDLSEETIQKLVIPELEDDEVENELETEDGEIEDEHPREVNQVIIFIKIY